MNSIQSFKIRQSSSRSKENKDYFNWEIWVEDGEMAISSVIKVEYLLHPSFPNRLITSTDLAQKFKIESSGWGEFMVNIIIYDNLGITHNINHRLVLKENYINSGSVSPEENPTKTVFLSYANSDTKFAKQLESKLNKLGINIKSH